MPFDLSIFKSLHQIEVGLRYCSLIHRCSANARPAAYISELVILCFDLLLELGNAEFRRTILFVKQFFSQVLGIRTDGLNY